MNAAMEVREAVAARPKPGRGTEGKRLVRAAEAKLLREDGLAEIRGAKLAGGKRPEGRTAEIRGAKLMDGKRPEGRIAVRATVMAPSEAAGPDAPPRSIKLPGAVLAALLGGRLEAGERGLVAPAEPAAAGGARPEAQAPEARRVKGFTPGAPWLAAQGAPAPQTDGAEAAVRQAAPALWRAAGETAAAVQAAPSRKLRRRALARVQRMPARPLVARRGAPPSAQAGSARAGREADVSITGPPREDAESAVR